MPMPMPSPRLCFTATLAACLLALVGCQVERSVVTPAEPDWSYHDGNDQLSNNDAWEQLVPASALLRYDEDALASVEDAAAE
ncbi:MAG: hypothetical protein ACPGYV_15025 [Phycisphaeraceae bacterium]